MIHRAAAQKSAKRNIYYRLLIVACLFICWLASTRHAQGAIKTLMKPASGDGNLITKKVQVVIKIKLRSVDNDRICGIVVEDFIFDYELRSAGSFNYAPDFSKFGLYAPPDDKPLTPEQILIHNASGYCIKFEEGCRGKTRHEYSTDQVGYPDGPYFDLRIEYPSDSEHCNVYFDDHVDLRFPNYSGNVLTSPEPGLYYDSRDVDYMVTPAMMQQAVREGSYHKTLSVRRGYHDDTMYRDLTLDVSVLFEPKEEGTLKVTPPEGLEDSCPSSNCDFKPLAKSYTLTNPGSTPINYTVSKTASWLELTSTSGVLKPGASATVTASVGLEAQKGLKEGVYQDTLVFTNTTNGKGDTSRAVKLEKSELQCWQVSVSGFEVDDSMAPTTYRDTDGTVKSLKKKVRFDWTLGGSFILRKEKGVWTFKSGKVNSASVSPTPDFTPSGVYQCQLVACAHKAPIAVIVGKPIFGHVSEGSIQLRWPPAISSGCLLCKTDAAGLPKTPYEAEFQSFDFMNQIGLESHPLKDGYSQTFTKQKWLQYTLTLKKLN